MATDQPPTTADAPNPTNPTNPTVDFGVKPFPASRDDVQIPEDDADRSISEDDPVENFFELGDMVWGKVKSHPWWPGHIFNEDFVSPSVRRSKIPGHVLVAFFGDSSYGYFDPHELIPFFPNFADKSRQTTLRTFVKAVDEAVDETSRREAIGLTCYCRSESNFRPTRVPKHFAVDVPGYEPGGIYSSKQIKASRERFRPERMLEFLREVCASPLAGGNLGIEGIGFVAQLQAYRKAVFEEYDETYAQAFGVEAVRPVLNSRAGSEQPERFARRAALLSGQLRTPPTNPATAKASIKQQSAKKNKYVLKRRDEDSGAVPRPSLPQFPSSSQPIFMAPTQQKHPPPDIASEPTESDNEVANLMLQLSPTHSVPVANQDTVARADLEPSKKEEPANFSVDSNSENVIANAVVASAEDRMIPEGAKDHPVELAGSALSVKKGKSRKRAHQESPDGGGLEGSEDVKKKKKKKRELVGEAVEDVQAKALLKREEGASVISLPPIDLPSLQLTFLQLLGDFKQLALDPFYGLKSNTPLIALHAFLKYRSLVYQKSLVLPLASEQVAQEARASNKTPQKSTAEGTMVGAAAVTPKEQKEPSMKPLKSNLKPDDSTKAGQKRMLSDRQGEMSEKRQKKLEKLKALPVEKKAALAQKPVEGHQQKQQKEANKVAAASALHAKLVVKATIAVTEPLKKQEQPVTRIPSPTNLVMKFPPRSTLPSVASLKAKLARYGQLDHSAIRVYWKTYTCKVLFKFRADAEAAMNDLRDKKDLFGQVKVGYFIREVEGTDLPAEPPRPKSSEGLQLTPGNGASGKSTVLPQQRKPLNRMTAGQPKSILKKPGNEVGGGANARDAPRVKFMLDSGEPRAEPLLPTPSHPLFTSNANVRSNADGPSYHSHTDPALSKTPRSISLRPPPPPLVSRSPLELNNIDNHQLPSPPSNPISTQRIRAPVDVQLSHPMTRITNGHEDQSALQPELPVDISDQMLRLLTKCSDIVTRIKTSGYVPYHPL